MHFFGELYYIRSLTVTRICQCFTLCKKLLFLPDVNPQRWLPVNPHLLLFIINYV